ncbi:MAG: PorT family protein [Tannerellaceae bacterium]|nr:PorT family protein [Tannerellaceae bacterium]
MKRIALLLCIVWLASAPASAQKFISMEDKAFNWGAKLGFNSTFPVINSLKVNEVEAEDVTVKYKVGYMAALFCRVNIERFFLQPGVSWHLTEGEIHYAIPYENTLSTDLADAGNIQQENRLALKTRSVEVPVLIGYNLVKEGPYALSLMAGPNLNTTIRYVTIPALPTCIPGI